ncbi:MAG: hypothetical protein ACK41Q_08450, partial [Candidatus Brocadia sp.]
MKRPKTMSSKRRIWFSMASIFLLVFAFALSMASVASAATGSFDRDTYLPSYSDTNDFDRAWISVTDSSGNVTNSQDTITVTVKAGNNSTTHLTTFKLKETGGTTTVFTTTGGTQPVAYPVGTTSGYVEDFNSGSHNFPALGTTVVGLNLKEFSDDAGGDATKGIDGNLTVQSGTTLELLYSGTTLDTALVKTHSGSFSFTPSAVSAVTTDTLANPNLIISITDPDENLNPVVKDVIGFADNSALLSGSPGTGSSRVQIEAIDQTTGSRLSIGGTETVARHIMLVETGNNTGVFTASGKVFGSSTATVNGNILIGSSTGNTSVPVNESEYTGGLITLGISTGNGSVTCSFRILEANASGLLGLYECTEFGTTTGSTARPALGFTTGNSFSGKGTSTFGIG